jgi:hypothetical protein
VELLSSPSAVASANLAALIPAVTSGKCESFTHITEQTINKLVSAVMWSHQL